MFTDEQGQDAHVDRWKTHIHSHADGSFHTQTFIHAYTFIWQLHQGHEFSGFLLPLYVQVPGVVLVWMCVCGCVHLIRQGRPEASLHFSDLTNLSGNYFKSFSIFCLYGLRRILTFLRQDGRKDVCWRSVWSTASMWHFPHFRGLLILFRHTELSICRIAVTFQKSSRVQFVTSTLSLELCEIICGC